MDPQALRVPVMRPRLPEAATVLPYLERVERSGRFSNFGPLEQELRARVGRFLHVPQEQVATASNATLALMGAMRATGASEWAVPAFTFAATPTAVDAIGHRGHFCDIRDDWWLQVDDATPAGWGLVPVVPFGGEVDLGSWPTTGDVVIDAAASLGTRPDLSGIPHNWSVVFSLHATKVLGAGEGGIVVFGDAERAEWFRRWSNFGFDSGRSSLHEGINAKLSEMQAAYALAAFDAWDQERSDWNAIRDAVRAVESRFMDVLFRGSPVAATINPYWIVECRDAATARSVGRGLAARGIETRKWWGDGCHVMDAFRAWDRTGLERTEEVAARYLGLPFYRGLGQEELSAIGAALEAIAEELSG